MILWIVENLNDITDAKDVTNIIELSLCMIRLLYISSSKWNPLNEREYKYHIEE
jgi:hypothetical protein